MYYQYTDWEMQELILARDTLALALTHKDGPTSEITSDICFTLFRLMQENAGEATLVDWHGLYSLLDRLYMSFKNNDESSKDSIIKKLQLVSEEIQDKIDSASKSQINESS